MSEGTSRFAVLIVVASIAASSVANGDEVAPITEEPTPAEASPDLGKKPIWKGMVIAGGVLSGVSALWVGSGLALYLSDPPEDLFDGFGRGLGSAYMIMGAAVGAVAIPFLAVGFADPRAPAVRVEVVAEGTGLAVRGSF